MNPEPANSPILVRIAREIPLASKLELAAWTLVAAAIQIAAGFAM
jgi:hypothetical protein